MELVAKEYGIEIEGSENAKIIEPEEPSPLDVFIALVIVAITVFILFKYGGGVYFIGGGFGGGSSGGGSFGGGGSSGGGGASRSF